MSDRFYDGPVWEPKGAAMRLIASTSSLGIQLERRREGIAKASRRVVTRHGHQALTLDIKRLSAELGPAAIAKRLGIARSSVYRLLPAVR